MSYNQLPVKTLVAFATSNLIPHEAVIDIIKTLEEYNFHSEILVINESILENSDYLVSQRIRAAAYILNQQNLSEFYKANILDRILRLSSFYHLTSSEIKDIDLNLYDYIEKTA